MGRQPVPGPLIFESDDLRKDFEILRRRGVTFDEGLALLVVLDSLAPSERLAFVLHDMGAVPFQDIGQILGKSADAAKMIASRGRRKVQATDRQKDTSAEHREVVQAFHAAARCGDFESLLRVLDPNVKLTVNTPRRRGGHSRRHQGRRRRPHVLR